MASLSFHQRLNDMRERAIRDASYRPVYAHAVSVAHLQGRLIASDHPGWARIEAALSAARNGDIDSLNTVQRELARLLEVKGS